MTTFRFAFVGIVILFSFTSKAQTVTLIGASEEFILQNVKGYSSVESRGIEHEEFDILVFGDKGRQLSFYFTFFRGDKVCSYIKNEAPATALNDELSYIKANYTNIKDNIWENQAKTVQVDIIKRADQCVILTKAIR